MKKLICLSVSLVSMQAFSAPSSGKIIYGEDNRIETFEATAMQQRLAKSTAGMISSVKLVKTGDHYMLPPYTIAHDMGLCKGERFEEQPSAVSCSGFLVAPDLLVTAGHCITTQADCDKKSWVFDYKVNESNKKTDILIPNSNVYKCSKVIEAKLENGRYKKVDYALVKLDRVVEGRAPLKYRTSGKVRMNEDLVVIGHPSGLPQKVAADAKVLENKYTHFFKTNLDTFGGNSGSAVFNNNNGQIEGILVRGAKDYDQVGNCRRVHKTKKQITDFVTYGEAVSRITDIQALKFRAKFLDAVKSSNTKELVELSKVEQLAMYDNEINSAAHIAVINGDSELLDALLSERHDLNQVNMKGQTALHLAVQNKDIQAIDKLISGGASALIKDKSGKTPKDYVPFVSFKLKRKMSKIEKEEKRRINI